MSAPLNTDEAQFWIGLVSYLTDPRGDQPDMRPRGDVARSRAFSRLSDTAVRVLTKRMAAS